MKCLRKFITVSSEEFVAVDDDNVSTNSIMADKEFVFGGLGRLLKAQKKTVDADTDDENERNNAAPVPTSSEIRSIMKIPSPID
ncbi:hypothetical protein TNCV_4580041 [Trichonephila clavipes]|nr:hypothetical protein TNCV_4580041 [Trichonephila clavipes]